MDVFEVILYALILPWLAGTLLVTAAQGRLARCPIPLSVQVGYGFFVGELILVLQIRAVDALGGGLGLGWNLGGLGLVLGLGGVLAWRSRAQRPAEGPPRQQWDEWAAWAILGMLMVLALHLLLVAGEVLWRPLFPWDAWTTWAFRAKVWAAQGELVRFVSPSEWLGTDGVDHFTIHAYSYPLFTSILQAWSAVAPGAWGDRLVNLPWLGLLLALLIGLYGQGRAYGLSATGSLLLATLLMAMPIVHTHAALAGYADLWLAGFTGLGLVALLQWQLQGDRFQLLLALVMLVGGVLVKREGTVWLLLGLLLWLLSSLGWRALWLLLPLPALAMLCGGDGCTLELPLLGQVGIDGGALQLGMLGRFPFVVYDASLPFLRAFLDHATWGLFWYVMLLSLPILVMRPFAREKRLFALLLSLFALVMVVIFFFTAEGGWAINFTSINRLPLHFAPALLFALACAWQAHWRGEEGR